MRLLASRRWSMEAIRRPSRVLAGSRLIGAIFDMDLPHLGAEPVRLIRLRASYVYQMPATTGLFAWQQLFVCIAAIREMASQTAKGRRKPAALAFCVSEGARLIRPPASAADRARPNRGSRRPGGRRSRAPGAGSRRCVRRAVENASPRSGYPTA